MKQRIWNVKNRLPSQKQASEWVLEDLERTPSLENNKAQLTPPRTAYREIKHHDDITQQGDD